MTDQPPSPSPRPPGDARLFPVMTLLRDDVTGDLVLQIGPRTYRNRADLEASGDRTRVEYAARDLNRWLEGEEVEQARKVEPRHEETPSAGGSMIQQINQILEGKLAAQPGLGRGIRLAEGPGGSVRVYIGVQGYGLDEVPDPAVRAAIREAVAEWEARS